MINARRRGGNNPSYQLYKQGEMKSGVLEANTSYRIYIVWTGTGQLGSASFSGSELSLQLV
jgi:hypothetical protein